MKTNITTSNFSSTAIFHIVIFVCVDRAASLVKVCSIHIHFKGLYLFSINDGKEVLYSFVSWLLFHLMIYTFSIQCPQLIIFRRVTLHKVSSAKGNKLFHKKRLCPSKEYIHYHVKFRCIRICEIVGFLRFNDVDY